MAPQDKPILWCENDPPRRGTETNCLNPQKGVQKITLQCIVGSISGPHLGVLESICGPHCRVNKGSTSCRSIKIVVSEDFSEASFQRGCKVFVVFWCSRPKPVFQKGGGKNSLCIFLFWWLLVDVTTRL